MTFLNPLVLFGLIAASIPVILHLLNLRKLRKIEFSSLHFLKELQKNKIRKIKIKQILLLILRTLIVILLVFSFSRPVMKGYLSGFGSHAKTSVVIILDDSYSMSRDDENGNYFSRAKESAVKIIELMEEGDDLSVIRTSQLPDIAIKNSINFQAAKTELNRFKIGYKFSNSFSAFNSASQILTESKNYNKEVYFITDNQKSNYKTDDFSGKQLFDNNTRLYIIDIGKESKGNNAIEKVEIANRIFEKESPINLKVTLRNYGAEAKNSLLSVYIAGKRVSQKNVEIGSTTVTDINFIPRQTGFVEGYVELEEDDLPLDNRRYFSFFIPERLNLLLSAEDDNDYEMVKLVLNSFSNDSLKESFFNISAKKNSAFVSTDLSGFDAILLFGAGNLSSGDVERIKTFLTNGGGLIFFPSGRGDAAQASAFLKELGVPSAGVVSSQNGSFLSFSKIDYNHPVLSGIFENKFGAGFNKQIESPMITKSFNLGMDKNSISVITLSNNLPFLLDCSAENKKLLVYAVNPGLEWSDYPFKGLFIPLTYKSVLYVSDKSESALSLLVGETAEINLKTGSASVTLKNPDGEEEKVAVNRLPYGSFYTLKNTDRPGIYTFSSNEVLKKIPVNLASEESYPEKMTDSELEKYMKSIAPLSDVKILSSTENISAFLQEARFGIELWKELIIAALLLLLLEMIIARDSKKELIGIESEK